MSGWSGRGRRPGLGLSTLFHFPSLLQPRGPQEAPPRLQNPYGMDVPNLRPSQTVRSSPSPRLESHGESSQRLFSSSPRHCCFLWLLCKRASIFIYRHGGHGPQRFTQLLDPIGSAASGDTLLFPCPQEACERSAGPEHGTPADGALEPLVGVGLEAATPAGRGDAGRCHDGRRDLDRT